MKIFTYAVIAVIAAVVVAGFFAVGSPARERLRRFDEQKIQNLQTIQQEVSYYWQNKTKLPDKLTDLNDSLRGFAVPKDPQSASDYEYAIKGAETFELCAVFNLPSLASGSAFPPERIVKTPTQAVITGPEYWEHGEGRTCFERTIDKDFYRIKPAG